MLNFAYHNPVRLVFGRGAENEAGRLAETVARTHKCLVVYGGGSVVRSGLLASVRKSLEAAGMTVIEKGGVHPNPRLCFVRETVDWMRDQGVGLVVAVGGGSVIDTAKCIALGLEYEGDCWDFFDGHAVPEKALPVLAVLTIPAAGSEQSVRCVISHHGTKAGIGAECLRPAAAIVNPECFMTLPRHQVAAGVVDMISHIMERYFTRTTATAYVDAQSEAAMRTAIEFGPKVWADARDYDSWCQIGMVGSFAHNGYFGLGREEDWGCHNMEHELSAIYDVAHGAGLAVVTPAWMRHIYKEHLPIFVQFAVNVMGVGGGLRDLEAVALEGIRRLQAFFTEMGQPSTLAGLGIDSRHLAQMAYKATHWPDGSPKPLGGLKKLSEQDALAVYQLAL